MLPFCEQIVLTQHAPEGPNIYRLRRSVRIGRWWRPRASLVRPTPVTEVLCLGAYAGCSRASQIATMTKGVGTGDAYWGSFKKGFTKVSRTEFEEDFMALLTHSDHGLGIAYDPENVIIGANPASPRVSSAG